MSCDHCTNEQGTQQPIVDRRSRRTMVGQLRAANALADAARQLASGSELPLRLETGGSSLATITLRLEQFLALWQAARAYQRVRPAEEDLQPPEGSPPAADA
jgi:hypothetical protein